jgi:hypothetical protein
MGWISVAYFFSSLPCVPSAITHQHYHWIDLSHSAAVGSSYTRVFRRNKSDFLLLRSPAGNEIFTYSSGVFIQIFTSLLEVKDDNDHHGVWE